MPNCSNSFLPSDAVSNLCIPPDPSGQRRYYIIRCATTTCGNAEYYDALVNPSNTGYLQVASTCRNVLRFYQHKKFPECSATGLSNAAAEIGRSGRESIDHEDYRGVEWFYERDTIEVPNTSALDYAALTDSRMEELANVAGVFFTNKNECFSNSDLHNLHRRYNAENPRVQP